MRRVCYKKLWKILIDKELNKTELAKVANVSGSTITRLAKDETVHLESLIKICDVLDCELQDILEVLPKNNIDV